MKPEDEVTPTPISAEYEKVQELMDDLSDWELGHLVGAIYAEFIDRGYSEAVATDHVTQALQGGIVGSRVFDQHFPRSGS